MPTGCRSLGCTRPSGLSEPDLVVSVDEDLWTVVKTKEKRCAGLNAILAELLTQIFGRTENGALSCKSAEALHVRRLLTSGKDLDIGISGLWG